MSESDPDVLAIRANEDGSVSVLTAPMTALVSAELYRQLQNRPMPHIKVGNREIAITAENGVFRYRLDAEPDPARIFNPNSITVEREPSLLARKVEGPTLPPQDTPNAT